MICHTLPEVVAFILNVVVPMPLALSALQIIAIDLGFELIAALSYAFELPENSVGLMKTPPRKPVSEESKVLLKKREAERQAHSLKIEGVDLESEDAMKPSLMARVSFAVKQPFTAYFWTSKFERPEGDILVDGNVLSWGYLEIGVIESISCLVTFFVVLYAGTNPTTGKPFGITPADAANAQTLGLFKASIFPAPPVTFMLNSGVKVYLFDFRSPMTIFMKHNYKADRHITLVS